MLVHRPRFDDWSLPKGKLKRGEHALAAACREVSEETGIQPSAGARLPTVSYQVWVDDALVDKVVDYWAMTVASELSLAGGDQRTAFAPGPEVDAMAWLGVGEALGRLSYPHDRRVVTAFAELPPLHSPVVLLRHASASERGSWPGSDLERPLDPAGVKRAHRLATVLGCFTPRRLISGSPRRCMQTLEPLAAAVELEIEVDTAFDETADPHTAAKRLQAFGCEAGPADAGAVVVCSQGGLIPPALATLVGSGSAAQYHARKGAGWVLSFADDAHLVAADQLE